MAHRLTNDPQRQLSSLLKDIGLEEFFETNKQLSEAIDTLREQLSFPQKFIEEIMLPSKKIDELIKSFYDNSLGNSIRTIFGEKPLNQQEASEIKDPEEDKNAVEKVVSLVEEKVANVIEAKTNSKKKKDSRKTFCLNSNRFFLYGSKIEPLEIKSEKIKKLIKQLSCDFISIKSLTRVCRYKTEEVVKETVRRINIGLIQKKMINYNLIEYNDDYTKLKIRKNNRLIIYDGRRK